MNSHREASGSFVFYFIFFVHIEADLVLIGFS